jgi:hypothetical protein
MYKERSAHNKCLYCTVHVQSFFPGDLFHVVCDIILLVAVLYTKMHSRLYATIKSSLQYTVYSRLQLAGWPKLKKVDLAFLCFKLLIVEQCLD